MRAPSSNTNSQNLSEIKAKREALCKKREEEDCTLEAKIVAKQKQIEEERIAEEKRAAKEKKKKEAVRKFGGQGYWQKNGDRKQWPRRGGKKNKRLSRNQMSWRKEAKMKVRENQDQVSQKREKFKKR